MKPPTTGNLIVVWASLMALALASFLLSFVRLGGWSTVIAVGIGVAKAVLIATFFMHLGTQPPVSRWSFGVGIGLALLLFVMIGVDVMTRQTPPIRQPGLELPIDGQPAPASGP